MELKLFLKNALFETFSAKCSSSGNLKKVAFKLIVLLCMANMPGMVYSIDMKASHAQWLKNKVLSRKEKTVDTLIRYYRSIKEGVATLGELKELKRRMATIKKTVVFIVSVSLAIIIAGGSVKAAEKYKKKKEGEEGIRYKELRKFLQDIEDREKEAQKGDYSKFTWEEIVLNKDIPIEEVKRRLDAGANPNEEGFRGLPSLYYALKNNRGDLVDLLVRYKADPDFTFERDYSHSPFTLLMETVYSNNYRMIYKLLQNGADPRKGLWGGPLYIANEFPVDKRIAPLLEKALVEWDGPNELKLGELEKNVGISLPKDVKELIIGKELALPSATE